MGQWPVDAHPSKFAKKTFVNGPKSAKFAKVFFLESFPVYNKKGQRRGVMVGENITVW